MPTITHGPDLGAGIMLYLKDCAAVTAFVGTKVFLEWPRNKQELIVPKFKNCVLINTGVGGIGDVDLGMRDDRVDILCYGADRKSSFDLWSAVDWWLCPKDRSRQTSFKRANVQVNVIRGEGGILRLVDKDAADWPFIAATYRFYYCGVPTS